MKMVAAIKTGLCRARLLLLLLVSLLLMSGCAPDLPPLKVGTNVWPGYESLYLARNKQLLDPQQITLVEKVNATQVIRDFKTGQLDVAALTMDEALTLLSTTPGLQVIAVMDFSEGADVLIAKPEINSLKALQGRTIVVEKTAVGAIMLQGALDKAGLSGYQIVVHNAAVNQHLSLWEQPEVAAVVTFEPVKSLLEAKGGQVLFDSAETPRRIMDVLVISRKTAEERPEQVKHLLSAHFAALAYMDENRQESAKILSERLKIPPKDVWQSFEGLNIPDLAANHLLLSGKGDLMQQTRNLKQLMLKAGLLNQDVPVGEDFITDRFLPVESE